MQEQETIDDDYPDDDSDHIFVPKKIDTIRAIRFLEKNFKHLKRLRWITDIVIEEETGRVYGIIKNDSFYGSQTCEVSIGEWLTLQEHAIIPIKDEDFRENYELHDGKKHNIDFDGNYPKFIEGDVVRFIGKEEIFRVEHQFLHYDGGDSFWGNVLLRSSSGEIIKTHCWMIEHV